MSSASIDLEMSRAMIIWTPSLSTVWTVSPHCGLARANIARPSAATVSARTISLPLRLTVAVSLPIRAGFPMLWSSLFRF